jgi:hypothetical protein
VRAKKQRLRTVRASLQHADGTVTRHYIVLGMPFLLLPSTWTYFDLVKGAQYKQRGT